MKKVGVFLPGRLASSRLPNKLILPIGDTCLWEIACKKLDSVSDKFEKCVLISKKDKELVKIAKKFKSLKIIYRSPETSLKDNPLNFVFKDIKKMKSDVVMFMNPCVLFLPKEIIEQVLTEVNLEIPYVESVKAFNSWLYSEDGRLRSNIDLKSMNTKFLEELYEPAHAFRVFDKKVFLKTGEMSTMRPSLFELNINDCIDVDTKEDYEYAKYLWEK